MAIYMRRKEWWQPWANTLAYRPLKSDFNDHSGNEYHLTNLNNATVIQTKDGVSCAYTNGSNAWLYTSALNASVIWQDFTCSFYWNSTTWTWVHVAISENGAFSWWNIDINKWQNLLYAEILNGSTAVPTLTKTTTISSWWHNVILTHSSDGETALYYDWVLQNTATMYLATDSYWVGVNYNNQWQPVQIIYYLWWIGEVIIEDKARTAQEVTDYYNNSKSEYWL